jgi:3-dehydroquinate synthase
MHRLRVDHRRPRSSYEIVVSAGQLERAGEWARACAGSAAKKVVIVSNNKVFSLYGNIVKASLKKAGFDVSVWLMKDGERYKNLSSLNDLLTHLSAARLSRDDVVVALGGGVVGDLAGFASAVYLRGIRFLQVPTTLLAMIDSSVGGKTGINNQFGKNLVGAFHNPAGVHIDVDTLGTLPHRELTAGFCEAVKQGAISGEKLFNKTADYLARFPPASGKLEPGSLAELIAAQVAFKASIVKQDEIEATERKDKRSRKILNFGHTFGHALEKITNYRRFRHGEAVGYGILVAGELSKNVDLLRQGELNLLYDVVHRVGKLPRVDDIPSKAIFEALKFDKKSTGGTLNWILLEGIGSPVIVPETDIPRDALTKAVKTILKGQ